MNKIKPYWKAVIGFVAPGAIVIGSAVLDASDGGSRVTQAEIITALVSMVVTGAGVFAKSNTDPTAAHQDESVRPPNVDGGF